MKMKSFFALILVLCLAAAFLAPAASAAEPPALGDFLGRYGALLGDKLGSLTDWLSERGAELPSELRDTFRDVDTEALFSDLKALVGETAEMDDETLRAAIVALAEKHGVHLVDAQIEQLMTLCRTLEKVDAKTLKEKAQSLKPELEAPAGLRGILGRLRGALQQAAGWFSDRFGGFFR